MSEPYLIVNTSAMNRLVEVKNQIDELVSGLKNEVYDRDTLVEENKLLTDAYDLKCNEKNDLYKEIFRLQELLTGAGISFEVEEDE